MIRLIRLTLVPVFGRQPLLLGRQPRARRKAKSRIKWGASGHGVPSQSMPQIQRCAWLSKTLQGYEILAHQSQHFREPRKGHPMSGSPGSAQQCPAICARRHDWLTEHLGGISPRRLLAQTKPETVSGGVGARPILGSPFPFHLMCIPRSPTAVRHATDEVISSHRPWSPPRLTCSGPQPNCRPYGVLCTSTRPSLTRLEESAASEAALAEGDRMGLLTRAAVIGGPVEQATP